MKRAVIVSGMIVLLLLFVLMLKNLFAEQVEHHGLQVDAEASLQICISCHDGSISHNVSFCTAKCAFNTPHAVLKDYPPRGEKKKFAPTATVLSQGIRLASGQITCISCHNLKNPAKSHLVIDNESSKLCLICHIK